MVTAIQVTIMMVVLTMVVIAVEEIALMLLTHAQFTVVIVALVSIQLQQI